MSNAPTGAGIKRWLQGLAYPGPRLVDEIECASSVLLAIALAHLIHAQNVAWAAFSGYMVMRGHVSDSLLRGALRILGTAVGAGLALLVVPAVHLSLPLSALACALAGGAAMYGALTGRRSYAWLFAGLTFEMILLDKLEHPGEDIVAFVTTRMLEVAAGTAACVAVSTLSTLTARRRWPGVRAAPAQRIGWHPHALRHAAQAAVALALLPVFGSMFATRELAQSAVSIMAAMLVPLGSLSAGGLAPVSRKLVQRVAGCLTGSALAGFFLYAAHGNASVLIVGTVAGVLVGRHIENGSHSATYVGTQFTLAILVTLVPDSYADAAIAPALDRLTGTLVGLALLEPVLIAWHLIVPMVRPGAALQPDRSTKAG
jgi:uncharacterized membrane protein YccC